MKEALLSLIFLFSLLTGCVELEQPRDDVNKWGLGLELPRAAPDPAPFIEGQAEVRKLRDFLANSTQELLDICGSNDRSRIEGYLPYEYYLDALDAVAADCNANGSAIADDLIRQMTANNSIDESLDALQAAAQTTIAKSRELLEGHQQVGSIVDHEVMVVLYDLQGFAEGALNSSEEYQGYFRENQNALTLKTAVLNAINPPRIAAITLPWILANFPWSNGTCQPDIVAIEAELNSLVEKIAARPQPDPGVGYQSNEWRIIMDGWGNLSRPIHRPLAKELGGIAGLSWRAEYLTVNYPLPTHEEAQFLFDSYRNQTRTLLTDRFLQHWLLDGLQDFRGSMWTEYGENKAAFAKSVFAMDWPLEELNCSPADAP